MAVHWSEMAHVLFAIGLVLGGPWLLYGCRWAVQLPGGLRHSSSHDEPDSTGTPLKPPQRPRRDNVDSSSTSAPPPAQPASAQPASAQPPRGPGFDTGSSEEEACELGAPAWSPARASVSGTPMPREPPFPTQVTKKFFEANGVTFRVNELSHDACNHANLEISAFNNWGLNVRCTCHLSAHARWKGDLNQKMPRDELKSKIRSALLGSEF